tara:strand:+ start:1012 stop:1878 length:867 start_codon:yes stop_codon:yes gene_type:complete
MIKVGIVGSGNIGSDLLAKIIKSRYLDCEIFAGRRLDSPGMKFAKSKGINISDLGAKALTKKKDIKIIFDATSAQSHKEHLHFLQNTNALIIDLTPAKTGVLCIPDINLKEALKNQNVNMVTCGGQAAVPIAISICNALSEKPNYIETVSTISSLSAGPGTRNSLDEYLYTTQSALKKFIYVNETKALINLNPASPPINMTTTVMVETQETNMTYVDNSVQNCLQRLKSYIPGIHFKVPPIYDYRRRCILVTIGVNGSGDYLPSFSGNLDIINCAAIKVAESYVKKHG